MAGTPTVEISQIAREEISAAARCRQTARGHATRPRLDVLPRARAAAAAAAAASDGGGDEVDSTASLRMRHFTVFSAFVFYR
jgi:hypothetical protein